MPQNPGGKDAVKECLHQRRAEEVLAFLGLKLHAERFLQGGADGGERGKFASTLDAGASIACVGGEKEGDIARVIQRRSVKKNAL